MRTKVVIATVITALALVLVASAGAATTSTSNMFSTQTQVYADGSHTTLDVTPDSTNALVPISNNYPCGNFGYYATQRWYDPLGFVLWTYRSHFAVHVCNNHVQYMVSLYDQAMDSNFGWSWCGNIVRDWQMNPNTASAHSYTQGCFTVFYKVAETRYPWAKMTIGGNGGLWARSTGVS